VERIAKFIGFFAPLKPEIGVDNMATLSFLHDTLTLYSGKTVEVSNCDAEG
jgi:hypothetical protein